MSEQSRLEAQRIAQLARKAESPSPIELHGAAAELDALASSMKRRARAFEAEAARDKCGLCGWWYQIGVARHTKGRHTFDTREGYCMNPASRHNNQNTQSTSHCEKFTAGEHGEILGMNFVGGLSEKANA